MHHDSLLKAWSCEDQAFVEKPRHVYDELQILMLLEHGFWSHTCGVWAGVCIDGCTLSITGINANCTDTDTDTEQLIILHCIHITCLL